MNIISGEKLQELADVYLGLSDDFNYNPYINHQKHKHKNLFEINEVNKYDNPKYIFCYTHCINILSDKIIYLKNDFILITHNSDENIVNNKDIEKIYNSNKLIKWYSQNLCINHNKLFFLPIGIANQQWDHGKLFNTFYNLYKENDNNFKKLKKSVYFYFEISTNKKKREIAYNLLFNKLPFLNKINPIDNLDRLSKYEFCICPEGNGIDTHRFWEALYLKCVPIVVINPLIEIINSNTNLPIIILNNWNDFDINKLPNYNTFNFEKTNEFLNLNFYRDKIKELI